MPQYRIFDPGSGVWADADILDPTLAVPGYMRKFAATSGEVIIDIIGKSSTAPGATEVTLAGMTVDAYVGWEDPTVKRADGSNSIRRGASLVEVAGSAKAAQIRLSAEAEKGATGILRLSLTGVPALTALAVVLVRGGRPL